MRFPWLQIDSDVIEAKAGDLAVLLGLSRRETIGLLVDLWAWCLTRSPKDQPPDGIISGTAPVPLVNRAASWEGPEGMLVAGLLEVGLIEMADGDIRFRGIGRYASTWTKNRRRKDSSPEPERNRSGTVGDPFRKTQTQTQTQKETVSASQGSADAGQQPVGRPPLVLTTQDAKQEPPARKPRSLSSAEHLYGQIQEARERQCKAAALPYTPDRWPVPQQNKLLGPIAKVPPGAVVDEEGRPVEFRRFSAAFTEYLSDTKFAKQGWPLSLFMSSGVRSRYEQQAAMAEVGT